MTLDRYTTRHCNWASTIIPPFPTAAAAAAAAGANTQDKGGGMAAAAAAGDADGGGSSDPQQQQQQQGLEWIMSVQDAAEPCDSTAGFNCIAKLRVLAPVAAAAAAALPDTRSQMAAAAAAAAGVDGPVGSAGRQGLVVRVDTDSGLGAAEAHLDVDGVTGQLLVVAQSGAGGGGGVTAR